MKRQASVGMFYLYTFLVVIIIAALTSCKSTNSKCDAYSSAHTVKKSTNI
jgi:hypothetical protein